jgi:hypothetical protein
LKNTLQAARKSPRLLNRACGREKDNKDNKEACLTFVKPWWPPGLFVVALGVPLDPYGSKWIKWERTRSCRLSTLISHVMRENDSQKMHITYCLQVIYGPGFAPRPITIAFTDTAEIGARSPVIPGTSVANIVKEDNQPGDAIRYTLTTKQVTSSILSYFTIFLRQKEAKVQL